MLQVRLLHLLSWSYRLFDDIAQCLYVLTEDNGAAIDSVRSESPYVGCLLEIVQKEVPNLNLAENNNQTRWSMLRVLSSGRHHLFHILFGIELAGTGILRNIAPLPSVIPASTIDLERTILLPLLVPQLSVKLQDVAQGVAGVLPQLV